MVAQLIDYRIIGKRIQKARTASGLTQEQLAEKIQVSTNYLSKIEGAYEKPNLAMLAKISVATDVSLASLLTGVVEQKEYLHSDIADILATCTPEKTRLIYDIITRIAQYD